MYKSKLLESTFIEMKVVLMGVLMVLMSDFNINLLYQENREVFNFVDVLSSNSFFPTITLPTRIANNTISLIDNILTNIEKYPI